MSSIEEPAANTGVTQSLSDTSITIMSSSEEAPSTSIEETSSPSPSVITSSIEVSQSLTSISRKRKADGRLGTRGTSILNKSICTYWVICAVNALVVSEP
jgi:hypothetical protein